MKLYERFADKGFHTSIATTFGIDFDAYESAVLPRLRGAGCRNNIVLTDSRMLTYALSGASALPSHAGKLYTVSGAGASSGVFHPKIFLQFGRRGGRLIVSSANLTASGLAGNLELMGALRCDEAASGEQRLIAQAFGYASRSLDRDQQGVAGQLEWMQARTPWLRETASQAEPVQLADQTLAALLTTGQQQGIGAQFAQLIEGQVTRLIVISPYWDEELGALSSLAQRLSAGEITILIDPDRRSFPRQAVSGFGNIKLYSRGDFRKGRFIHAKTLIAQTASADHVLLGSANCTVAALGREGFRGHNEEVCLYRRFDAGTILERLGLKEIFAPEHVVDPQTLDPMEAEEDLPMAELGAQTPGQFEARVDTLIWQPTNVADPAACTITLADESGQPIACILLPLGSSTRDRLRFQIVDTDQQPSFARITFPDGRQSAFAIVTQIDRLRAVTRESYSRGTEKALRQLDNETEAHLGLLDVLDVMEKIETDERKAEEPRAIPKTAKATDDGGDATKYKTLNYEEFVAGRRPRAAGKHVAHNTLAGSEVSIVRGFLNRILGVKEEPAVDETSEEEEKFKNAFNLGDETGNAEAALAAGEEFEKAQTAKTDEQLDQEERHRRAQRHRATKEQIRDAVTRFQGRIKSRLEADGLTNQDILRLRALLMIVCSAAAPPLKKGEKTKALSELQVLPPENDADSWPMTLGRLLFILFGGKKPAILDLYLSAEHDQIPDDIVECWATCYWCILACRTAPLSKKEGERIARFLDPLAEKVYLLTMPSKTELLGDDITTFIDRMSERFAERLGIQPHAIADHHLKVTEQLPSLLGARASPTVARKYGAATPQHARMEVATRGAFL